MPDEAKIPNYPGNSQVKKERVAPNPEAPQRKLERVTTSEPIKAKKTLGKRIAETFTGDDMHSVGSYLLFEVLIPAAKNMIVEGVEQGIQRMLFGDSRPSSRSGRSSYTPYNRVGTTSRNTSLREEPRTMSRAASSTHDFNEILVASRPEAMMVVEGMIEAAEVYETVTVADFYSLVGITPNFVDNQWGWERADISVNDIRRTPQGYMFTFPKPIHLK